MSVMSGEMGPKGWESGSPGDCNGDPLSIVIRDCVPYLTDREKKEASGSGDHSCN